MRVSDDPRVSRRWAKPRGKGRGRKIKARIPGFADSGKPRLRARLPIVAFGVSSTIFLASAEAYANIEIRKLAENKPEILQRIQSVVHANGLLTTLPVVLHIYLPPLPPVRLVSHAPEMSSRSNTPAVSCACGP